MNAPKKFTITRDIVCNVVVRHAHGAALDVGAGTSKYAAIIQPKLASYKTLDIKGGPGIDIVGDAAAMPCAGDIFDCVLSFQLFEHVPDPHKVASECFRVLKPGGKIIATMPFGIPVHGDPGDYWRYTADGVRELFTSKGFVVCESGTYGGALTVLAEGMRFVWLNPYVQHGWFRTRFFRTLHSLLIRIDAHVRMKSDAVLYANVYIVAEKPAA